ERQVARVGQRRSGEDIHERALAGPVLADERVNLPRVDRETHPRERDGGAECLANVDGDETLARHRYSLSHFLRSGKTSSWTSGFSRFCPVTSVAPVSMRGSTF